MFDVETEEREARRIAKELVGSAVGPIPVGYSLYVQRENGSKHIKVKSEFPVGLETVLVPGQSVYQLGCVLREIGKKWLEEFHEEASKSSGQKADAVPSKGSPRAEETGKR